MRSPGFLPGPPERGPWIPAVPWRRRLRIESGLTAKIHTASVWCMPWSIVPLTRMRDAFYRVGESCAYPYAGHRHRSFTCSTTGTNRRQFNKGSFHCQSVHLWWKTVYRMSR